MIRSTGPLGGARFAVTDGFGGVSAAPYAELNLGDAVGDDPRAVAENRRRLAAALGLTPDRVAVMHQVHGADVAVVDGPPVPGRPAPEADGLVTREAGVALLVVVADCVPVLLADRDGTVAGVAHAGRRGVVAGVVPATVAAMTRLGARPDRISARIGPAVCGRCYEVPAALRAKVAAQVPASAATTCHGTPALDLTVAVAAQLTLAGVTDVITDRTCTVEDLALFSYRRETRTGRFAGVVVTR